MRKAIFLRGEVVMKIVSIQSMVSFFISVLEDESIDERVLPEI